MRKFKELSLSQKIIRIIILVFVVCLIIVAGVIILLRHTLFAPVYEPDIVIPSPDGQYELLVREWGALGGGGFDLYIRKPGQDKWYNSWMKKEIGTTVTDDYFRPFSAGDYCVEWESDRVTVRYCSGYGPDTWDGEMIYEFD